ncbi:MAG: pyridoxal-phosphate dependent enzyme [Planctomycetota bacterium]
MQDLFASVPRIDLGAVATPIEEVAVEGLRFRVQRDDRIGGNKLRPLEFVLARPAKRLLTFSTLTANHALATVRAGRRIGLDTDIVLVRWGTAGATREIVRQEAARVAEVDGIPGAAWRALRWWQPGTRIVPPGAMSPAGALGYARAVMDWETIPSRVYLPHGTGTTTSGLLLGLMLREADCEVVAVNVTERTGGEWRRAFRAARLLKRRVQRGRVRLRVVPAREPYGELEGALPDTPFPLDRTYGAKALRVLLEERPEHALFLVTTGASAPSDPSR